MAERPKTHTSTSTSDATPDATAPIPKAAASSNAAHVPARSVVGYVVERAERAYRMRTVLIDGDTCTTVATSGNKSYHQCVAMVTRAMLTDRRKQ